MPFTELPVFSVWRSPGQAEVGTATAMAAAGLMAVLNGTPRQVGNLDNGQAQSTLKSYSKLHMLLCFLILFFLTKVEGLRG